MWIPRRLCTPAAAAASVVAAALLAACGSSGHPSAASGGGAPAAQGTVVTADLSEYRIALSATPATAGTYTFVATNRGSTVHALEVRGPGGTGRTGDLGPGQSGRFTVRVSAGSTDVFCPVGSHKELGMDVTLSVP